MLSRAIPPTASNHLLLAVGARLFGGSETTVNARLTPRCRVSVSPYLTTQKW